MRASFLIFISFLTLLSCNRTDSELTLMFTGDVILDRGVDDQIRLHGDSLLINSIKNIKHSDFFIINYEGTFTESDVSQNKLYNFKSCERRTDLLKQGGVTHVSIANNHSYDYGSIGFKNTIKAITDNKLIPLGESCEPKILRKGKYQCAVLSVSLTARNDSLCISSINQLKTSVENFKQKNKSIPLIIYIHWGLELQPKPESWQILLAEELIDLGVEAIIGHHPHIIQPIEFINGKPVFYSIGNFIADAYLPETDFSYAVELTIKDRIVDVRIIPLIIKRYFPKIINHKEQDFYIKKLLAYSDNVCAIQLGRKWIIKSINEVDFSENSNLWFCKQNSKLAVIKRLQVGSYLLNLYTPNDTSNTISLHGQLSEIEIADINNDGVTDIILGVSKKVNFDPVVKKRINIYTYQNKNLQPLWLGTKFIHDIESFNVKRIDDLNYLETVEIDNEGNRYRRIYEWDDFGFALTELNKPYTYEN